MGNYEFKDTHDWEYLADYFDIVVDWSEVANVKQQLREKDLYIDTDNYSEWTEEQKDRSVNEVGYHCYYCESDIYRDIKLNKLKRKIGEARYHAAEHNDEGYQNIEDVCRAFIEEFVEEPNHTHTEFWEHLLEIDNSYVFLDVLKDNLKDLWW